MLSPSRIQSRFHRRIGKMFFFLFLTFQVGNSVRILTSSLKLSEYGDAISGAKLIDDRIVDGLRDVSFCIRFNYKLLGRYEGRSRLITISSWRQDGGDPEWDLTWFGANYPFSFLGFGSPRQKGFYKSFLLRDPDESDFEIWSSNRWSHVCLAYQKSDGYLRIVKDGKTMSIDR